jgi:hypothetical protein
LVKDNTFAFNAADIGSDCTIANTCGYNGLFSEAGSVPSGIYNGAWPFRAAYPYAGYKIPNSISNRQNNKFTDNLYCASAGVPWRFVGFAQGNAMTPSQWTRGVRRVAGSRDRFKAQDRGSVFTSGTCPS